jgi:hypothetical protein
MLSGRVSQNVNAEILPSSRIEFFTGSGEMWLCHV